MMNTPSSIDAARAILRSVFGFEDFRNGQHDVITSVLDGNDTLAVMPTGGGKSLCYQIPALLFPDVTVVVSPLIALMKDQTDRLRTMNVKAEAIHSGMSQGDVNNILARAKNGDVRMLYVSPERLSSVSFRRLLRSIPLSLLAVDEAHCISEWGHDFRPSYRAIASIFDEIPRVPILALTATATPDVRTDITSLLALRSPTVVVRGFDRPNLTFTVVQTQYKAETITRIAKRDADASILVYCGSRRRVDALTHDLQQRGLAVRGYHAGKTEAERSEIQDAFVHGSCRILVATSAFGMGIDKPDIRHVIHTDLTLTLEAYYQEAGRAGRDGLPSTCTMIAMPEDRRLMEFFLNATYPERAQIAAVYTWLCDLAGVQEGSEAEGPVLADESRASTELGLPRATVTSILAILQRHGCILRTTAGGNARITIATSNERLRSFAEHARPERKLVMDAIVRVIGGKGQGDTAEFSVREFILRCGCTPKEFADTMHAAQMARMLRFTPPHADGGITIIGARLPVRSLPIEMEALHLRRSHAFQKLDVVVRYVSTTVCKRNFILEYFGDHEFDGTCGKCSSCVAPVFEPSFSERRAPIVDAVIKAAIQVNGRFGRHVLADIVTGTVSEKVMDYKLERCVSWQACANRSRFEVLETIDECLAKGLLEQTADLYPTVHASEEAIGALDVKPLALNLVAPQRKKVSTALLNILVALRDAIAQREGVTPASLLGLKEVESIAMDAPESVKAMREGRHGGKIFIDRFGEEFVAAISSWNSGSVGVPKPRSDEDDAHRAAALVQPLWDLQQLASAMHRTPAATAHAVQRAVELGLPLQRGGLVPDSVYTDVLEYVRTHRYAKLRHVRESIDADVDPTVLRVALAFARNDLFDVARS